MSRPRSLAANLLLGLLASAIFLAVLEGAARFLERKRPPLATADYIWDWDEKMPGGFYTIRSDATGWPAWEEFNRDGLRDRTRPQERPEGYWRVAVLGDSVTLGAETRPEESFPQQLEALLTSRGRRFEVMNVALWGWSTRQERVAYERIARRYRPDQVLLGVCLNDIPELQKNLRRPAPWVSALHQRSALARRVVDARGREIRNVEQLFVKPGAGQVREAMSLFFEEVRLLRKDVDRDGARFAMVLFPFRFQLEAGAPAPTVQEGIASFCRAEGIECLDLLPALRKRGAESFADYDHLSPSGAVLVAETVLASGLLPEGYSNPEALGRRFEQGPVAEWVKTRDAAVARPAVPSLGALLADRDVEVRVAAAWALESMGSAAAAAVPALIETLRADSSEAVRAACAKALGALGARGAVSALFTALADESQNVRWAAAQALSALELTPDVVEPLAAALESPDPYVRSFAAWTLGNMGAAAQVAVPALVEALGQPEGYGRGGASAALAKMGASAEAAVPALVRGLKDPDGERRWKAARTLGRIGPPAREAVPALVDALKDPHDFVRANAARALGRIAPAQAREALTKAAHDPEAIVRREAVEALDRAR